MTLKQQRMEAMERIIKKILDMPLEVNKLEVLENRRKRWMKSAVTLNYDLRPFVKKLIDKTIKENWGK